MVKSYRDLIVWQRSIELSLAVYRVSSGFPAEERFGITSQLRRSAVSVPSNIAEGYGRNTRKDYKQFLAIARGSTLELQTQMLIALKLGYCKRDSFEAIEKLSDEVSKMLYSMLAKL